VYRYTGTLHANSQDDLKISVGVPTLAGGGVLHPVARDEAQDGGEAQIGRRDAPQRGRGVTESKHSTDVESTKRVRAFT